MTLRWTKLSFVRAGGDDWVTGQMWMARGQGRGYTVSEIPSRVVQTSSFKPWVPVGLLLGGLVFGFVGNVLSLYLS